MRLPTYREGETHVLGFLRYVFFFVFVFVFVFGGVIEGFFLALKVFVQCGGF